MFKQLSPEEAELLAELSEQEPKAFADLKLPKRAAFRLRSLDQRNLVHPVGLRSSHGRMVMTWVRTGAGTSLLAKHLKGKTESGADPAGPSQE